ncbi:DUF1003 domain-containing protein [Chitinophaga nivalis]|uniref:DUF1003 domain-containing protein n=1 Tax=Chitinophaga nivalis TaxID=2991709 RepID=A0ABT3IWP3_9BACT|nr:DUF1003 domain-containing protein [Chitinophaga nivalis]MCW3461920.1 DUF1003 domain-containing protein [Chitinophaga nivalis]MCW3488389.1 DUF1003 domain-containing protein [Chitinophaga nivalis]
METFISDISGKHFPLSEKVTAKMIRPSMLEQIRKDHPKFNHHCNMAVSELNSYRQGYYASLFSREMSELSDLEKVVLEKLRDNETLTNKLEEEPSPASMTYGERLADRIAEFGGSWTFIISFLVFILAWMCLNLYWLANKGFDPYPFILLNLILSCLAALQAPVIMMSQNRQESKDRQRSKNDYMINLKSELEVRILHEKIDHLMLRQQQDMLDLQQTQLEMLNEILKAMHKTNKGNSNSNQSTTDTK